MLNRPAKSGDSSVGCEGDKIRGGEIAPASPSSPERHATYKRQRGTLAPVPRDVFLFGLGARSCHVQPRWMWPGLLVFFCGLPLIQGSTAMEPENQRTSVDQLSLFFALPPAAVALHWKSGADEPEPPFTTEAERLSQCLGWLRWLGSESPF